MDPNKRDQKAGENHGISTLRAAVRTGGRRGRNRRYGSPHGLQHRDQGQADRGSVVACLQCSGVALECADPYGEGCVPGWTVVLADSQGAGSPHCPAGQRYYRRLSRTVLIG